MTAVGATVEAGLCRLGGHAAWADPEAPGAEAKEYQTYCSKLVRSSQATPTETAKAAPM